MARSLKKNTTAPTIYTLRGQKVVLDADLAELYGVTTGRLNEQVRRNLKKFPDEFAFRLDNKEVTNLMSQNAISSLRGKHGGRRKPPYVFTEHGALMAATVLKSNQAVEMSLFIVKAFIKMREALASNQAVLKKLAQIDKTLLEHDVALKELYESLIPLLFTPETDKKKKIGFHKK